MVRRTGKSVQRGTLAASGQVADGLDKLGIFGNITCLNRRHVMRYVAEASGAVLDTETATRAWYDSHAAAIAAAATANALTTSKIATGKVTGSAGCRPTGTSKAWV